MAIPVVQSVSELIKDFNESVSNVVKAFKERSMLTDYIEVLQLSAEFTIRLLTGAELLADEDDDGEIVGGIDSKEFADIITIEYIDSVTLKININNSILGQLTRIHEDWKYERKTIGKNKIYHNKDNTHYDFNQECLTITVDR